MSDLLGILPAAVAALVALGWLFRRARRAARTLDAIERVVQRELTPAGEEEPNSMKEDVHVIAQAVGGLQSKVRALETRVEGIDARVTRLEAAS